MAYPTIKKIFHSQGTAEADKLYLSRREGEATMSWDFPLGEHSLFALAGTDVLSLTERVYRLELSVQHTWLQLPPGARSHYVRSLLLDEVVSTNAIEGVHSTRRQVQEALASENSRSTAHRRFRELSRLYMALGEGTAEVPRTLSEVRRVYDQIMDGELNAEDRPDGDLFRAELIDVHNQTGKAVHRGFHPEAKINRGLLHALDAMTEENDAPLLSALMSHFMFETVRPFYDGNGRTGRYFLGIRLSELLSIPTALTLSRVLNQERRKYYQGFTDVQDPLNRGDGTPFALMVLSALAEAQQQLIGDLEQNAHLLNELTSVITRLREEEDALPEVHQQILFMLGQIELFGLDGGTKTEDIAHFISRSTKQARRYLSELESEGLIATTSKSPLRFVLAPEGRRILELPDP